MLNLFLAGIRLVSIVALIPWGFFALGIFYPMLKPLERLIFIPITLSYPLALVLCWRREAYLRGLGEVGMANLFAVLPLLLVFVALAVGAYFNTRGP